MLSNQLSTFREQFIEADNIKNEQFNIKKEHIKSKSSQRSFHATNLNHEKKKSFDNISNTSKNKNDSVQIIQNTKIRSNAHIDSTKNKKNHNKSSTNFISNVNYIKQGYYEYLKDEANYLVGNQNKENNSNQRLGEKNKSSRSNEKIITQISLNKINTSNNFIYEITKNKNIIERGNSMKNNLYDETVEKNNSIKNLQINPDIITSISVVNNIGNIPKSPLKRLQDKVNEKDKEILALEQKLKQANISSNINEKNAYIAEKKVESLHRLLGEILSRAKSDQITIERLNEEITKAINISVKTIEFDTNGNSNFISIDNNQSKLSNNNNYGISCDLKNDEIIIHKIYSNFINNNDKNGLSLNDQSQNYKLSKKMFYFVLIFDKSQESFYWVDLSNFKISEIDKNMSTIQKNQNVNKEMFLILEAINYFEEVGQSFKKNANQTKSNMFTTNENNYASKIISDNEKMAYLDNAKVEKYKNFSCFNLPLQNLYSIEKEIFNFHSDYLNFEKELNQAKIVFVDEVNKKESIIKNLKIDLEKLIEDNTNVLQSIDMLNVELNEREKIIANLINSNKEKEEKIEKLNLQLNEGVQNSKNEKEQKSFFENRIAELQQIIIEKENKSSGFQKEILKIEEKLLDSKKQLEERDDIINNFTIKLEELENKYKNKNYFKVGAAEKNESALVNVNNEERNILQGKIHELELMKNSNLDKISILEYINKNFENEKTEREILLDEMTNKVEELNQKLKNTETYNKEINEKLSKLESNENNNNIQIKKQIEDKDLKIKNLFNLNEELEVKINNNLEEISSLAKTIEVRNKSIQNYEKEIKEHKKELKEIKFSDDEKSQQLTSVNKKILDLENQIRFNFEKFDEEKARIRDELNSKLNIMLLEKSDILSKYQVLLEEFNKYQQNTEKIKKGNEENIKKLNEENKRLKLHLNEISEKSNTENEELKELLIEFNHQVEQSEKLQKEFLDSQNKLKDMNTALLLQEETIKKMSLEKEETLKFLEDERNKNTKTNLNCNENIENLNSRILEIQKINIQCEKELKEKDIKINMLEKEKDSLTKNYIEIKEINQKNSVSLNDKNKKLVADEFTIKDLNRKLKDLEIDLKNLEDENLQYKNKIESLEKTVNLMKENHSEKSSKNSINNDKQNQQIYNLESEMKVLLKENNKLKDDLENTKLQCERLIDELNENNILRLEGQMTKRGDEVNVTLYGNNNNLNNSSHLNNSNSILDLKCINENNNNNYIRQSNYNLNNNREKENNENMLKIMDYEDKLEKLIFSNSEMQRINNSLTIEIKTLQEKIFALENFEEPEINKKLKHFKKQDSNVNNNLKDFKTIQIEYERLVELNKDYEMSISQLQNKLEMQEHEMIRIREEFEEEIINAKKREPENFSFFANEKTIEKNNMNNMTFFDSNENDWRLSNMRISQDEHMKKLNMEIIEKNKLIEKLTKELNDSYALMGEANKKLEIFEVDYLNKSK